MASKALMASDPLGRRGAATRRPHHPVALHWLGIVVFAVACILLRDRAEWLVAYPASAELPVIAWFNVAGRESLAAFIAIAGVILLVGLTGMPWPAVIAIIVYFGYRLGGIRLAAAATATLAFRATSMEARWRPQSASVPTAFSYWRCQAAAGASQHHARPHDRYCRAWQLNHRNFLKANAT